MKAKRKDVLNTLAVNKLVLVNFGTMFLFVLSQVFIAFIDGRFLIEKAVISGVSNPSPVELAKLLVALGFTIALKEDFIKR